MELDARKTTGKKNGLRKENGENTTEFKNNGGKRRMKRIRKLIILMGLIGGLLLMSGCAGIGKTKEDEVKDALRAKYNEEFIIHKISNLPGGVDVVASPLDNPEIVFSARISDDASYVSDDYLKQHINYLIKERVTADLLPFFIDVFVHVDSRFSITDESTDFKNKNLKELIGNMKEYEGDIGEAYIDVFINEDRGTKKDYKNEYYYFSETVNEYVNNKEMIPIIVEFYWIDGETKEEIEKYFSENAEVNNTFIKDILKTDNFQKAIRTKEDEDAGNPRRIVVSFGKESWNDLIDYQEYKRRREILENGN